MNKFVWGGANDERANIDYHHRRTLIVIRARLNYARLAKALAAEGKNELAVKVLDYCMDVLPLDRVPYDPYVPDLIEAYFNAGAAEKAVEMTKDLSDYYFSQLDYYFRQTPYVISSAEYEIQSAIQYTFRAAGTCGENGVKEVADEINARVEDYYSRYIQMHGPAAQ